MEATDKIYVYIPDDDIVGTASTQKGFPHRFVTEEYIHKDALLKYLRNEFDIVDFHLKAQDDPVWWGQRNAFHQVIDKIESL